MGMTSNGKVFNRDIAFYGVVFEGGRLETPDTTEVTTYSKDMTGYVRHASGATVPTDAEANYAVGCIFEDTDGGVGATLYINEGSVTSCDFNAITAGGSATAYDDIGNPDASGSISFAGYTATYTSSTANWGGMIFSNTHADPTAGATLLTLGYTADGDTHGTFLTCKDNASADAKFTVGLNGATTIAGNATGTAALTVTAGDITMTAGDIDIAADNREISFGASGATDSYIKFNGTSLVFFDATLGVEATLSQLANNTPTGDFTLGNQFAWTDAADEQAGTWSFGNTTGNDIAWASLATTGKCLAITANGLTSGAMVYLESSVTGLTSGDYIRCYDGSAEDFSVGIYGTTTIAGNASTDILIITAGDLQITAGDIDMDLGFITVDNTADEGNYFKRNNATGTAPVLEIEQSHTTGGVALLVDQDATGDVNALEITNAGTGFSVSATGAAAGSEGFEFIAATGATGNGLLLDGTTGTWVGADGVGFAQIASDGALAHANASCLLIAYSGAGAATGMGTSLRIVDTGTTATSYAAYISAATGEALKVDAGTVQFDEALTLGVDDTGADLIAFGATAGKGMHWDESADTLILKAQTFLEIGGVAGTADGVTFDFDGADLDIDAVTANDNIKFGSDVDTNVIFYTASGAAMTIDHGADTITCAYGLQISAVARTATADGTGTGTIAAGTSFVSVTSASADNIIILPAPVVGNIVWLMVGATGYELRSSTPATIAINGGAEAAAESAIGANVLVRMVCTSATTWVGTQFTAAGTESAVQVAAA